MGAKRIAYSDEARDSIRKGVKKLAKAVKITLGPLWSKCNFRKIMA